MNNSLIKNLLSALPIFDNLNDDEYRILAFIGKKRNFNARDTIYRAKDVGEGAILVLTGRIMVNFHNKDKKNIAARRGMMVNEMSLFVDKRYEYDLIALEEMSAMYFLLEDFTRLVDEFPEIAKKIQNNIANRMTNFSGVFMTDNG